MFQMKQEKNLSSSWETHICKGTEMRDSMRTCEWLLSRMCEDETGSRMHREMGKIQESSVCPSTNREKRNKMIIRDIIEEAAETAQTRDV